MNHTNGNVRMNTDTVAFPAVLPLRKRVCVRHQDHLAWGPVSAYKVNLLPSFLRKTQQPHQSSLSSCVSVVAELCSPVAGTEANMDSMKDLRQQHIYEYDAEINVYFLEICMT